MALIIKEKKIFVAGVTGSGKTYFTENHLLKGFKTPLVITPHEEDYTKAHKGVLVHHLKPYSTDNLNRFIKDYVEPLAKKGEIDAFFIDEADMIIPKSIQLLQMSYSKIYDMFINHRHWKKQNGLGLALGCITRRPQEMNTMFIEQSHHLFIFALEGKNVNQHLSAIHKDFDILLPKLDVDKHNFIHKQLGKAPAIHEPIKSERTIK
jgi:hypothetical protein